MTKFEGSSTVNSRIKIDYRGVKPKVTFSYPDEKNQVHGSLFGLIFMACALIIGIYMMGWNSSDSLKQYSNLEEYTDCVKENPYENYSSIRFGVCNQTVIGGMQQIKETFNLKFILILFGFFGVPFLIYYPFKKKWDALYPKVEAFLSRKRIRIFYPKDVREYEGEIYCEVPLFHNIILNYEATKDFSKYLDFFEIREHNFKYQYKKRIRKPFAKVNKRIVRKNRQKTMNDTLWYAKFYFSQKPKQGKLSVLFK